MERHDFPAAQPNSRERAIRTLSCPRNSILPREFDDVVSRVVSRCLLRRPQGLLMNCLAVAGDGNRPIRQRVTVPSHLDGIEQVDPARAAIGRNVP